MFLEFQNRFETQENARMESDKKDEGMDEKQAVAMAKAIFSVSDSGIAPKPFFGKTSNATASETDPQSWLEFFELYCRHRGLTPYEKLTLFPFMMRDGAADWLATISSTQLRNYDSLIEAFRDNYFVPVQLRWKETGLNNNNNNSRYSS